MPTYDVRAAEAANRGLIDIGRFSSRHWIVEVFTDIPHHRLHEMGFTVKVEACSLEKDPFMIV